MDDAAYRQEIENLSSRISELTEQFAWLSRLAEPELAREQITEFEQMMSAPDFWNNQQQAAKTSAAHKRLEKKLSTFEQLSTELETLQEYLAMEDEFDDNDELLGELRKGVATLDQQFGELQEASMFSGEYDAGPAIVNIHSGEGGVDAQDWAEMLMRMYLRFWEKRDFSVDMIARTDGDEAGIRSASFIVDGDYAYGIMNAEAGVHRLVRQSPFDSASRRHTSFAQIEVAPYIDDDVDIEIDDTEIRVDTYRASGAGGQHVNKTDSAVRITHEPTGIVVQCQNQRSQHQNRDTAMKMLKSRLVQEEKMKRDATIASEKGAAQNVGFGSQIRSYVLHPYQMVKDLRTKEETGNVQAVLDGDLDQFIRALLMQNAVEATKA